MAEYPKDKLDDESAVARIERSRAKRVIDRFVGCDAGAFDLLKNSKGEGSRARVFTGR
jgi:hypothetical protein